MSPEELVDQNVNPGGYVYYGTDEFGYKNFHPLLNAITVLAPAATITEKAFTIASDTWTWAHGFGFYPIIEVRNSSREVMLAHITHQDVNTVVVRHAYNATGYIVAR